MTVNKCKWCGALFETENKNTLYCCNEHRLESKRSTNRERYKNALVSHTCPVCKKEFLAKVHKIYCSDECLAMRNEIKDGTNKEVPMRPSHVGQTEAINKVNSLAQANGMDYGELVARQYLRKQVWVNKLKEKEKQNGR